MKPTIFRSFGLLALAAFPLASGYSQNNTPAPAPAAPVPVETTAPAPAPAPNAAPTITIKVTSDLAEVEKLAKAGMGEDVIQAYIKNSHSTFNLTANDILRLRDEGISATVLTSMLNHDSAIRREGANQPPGQFNYNQQAYAPAPSPAPGQTVASLSSQPDGSADKSQIATPPLVPNASPDGSQPPPPQTEVIPVSPGPDYYWAPGYWGWNGGWIWVGGFWCPRTYWGWGWRPWGWGWHGGVWHGGWHGGGWGRTGGGWSGGGSHSGGGWGRAGHH